jgi:ribose transport system ATP-binding protein
MQLHSNHKTKSSLWVESGAARDNVIDMIAIQKSFPGVHALKGVGLSIRPGEVRGLAGENGAGKSTLIKILSGAYTADGGRIFVGGREMTRPTPQQMIDRGIAVIYQELTQAPHLTVAENVLMGRLPRGRLGQISWSKLRGQVASLMESLGFALDPNAIVGSLSVAQRQMVEIAKAISRDARLIVLDEPSAVLGDTELERLFSAIGSLSRMSSVAFLYVSHRLKEFFELCQSVTVLRDGDLVDTRRIEEVDHDDLIRMMVGRSITQIYPERGRAFGDPILKVRGLSRPGQAEEVDFELRRGEILGICGLVGSGRSELLHAIAGADDVSRGAIEVDGRPLRKRSIAEALSQGVGLLPEDRKTQGLFLSQTVGFNITISSLRSLSQSLFLSPRAERSVVTSFLAKLRVRPQSGRIRIENLSGGNQQKCLLARQLNAGCRIFLIDEPTRGVDVGAREDIYRLLRGLAAQGGTAILIVSSDLPEVINLCDRIIVMRQGHIAAIMDADKASEEDLMRHATWH